MLAVPERTKFWIDAIHLDVEHVVGFRIGVCVSEPAIVGAARRGTGSSRETFSNRRRFFTRRTLSGRDAAGNRWIPVRVTGKPREDALLPVAGTESIAVIEAGSRERVSVTLAQAADLTSRGADTRSLTPCMGSSCVSGTSSSRFFRGLPIDYDLSFDRRPPT